LALVSENSSCSGNMSSDATSRTRAAELVKASLKSGKNLRELVLEKDIMSESDWNDLIEKATSPNL